MEELTVEEARELLMADADGFGKPVEQELSGVGPNNSDASSDNCESGFDGADACVDQAMNALLENASTTEDDSSEPAQLLFDEGSVGLGVDIVDVNRMAALLERIPSFAERVYSPAERKYCESKANFATHYALRFAAKEAVVKALGTGFAEGIWVRDIEVERSKSGKPLVKLMGRALEVARERGVREFSLSLSYTHNTAVACALAITESSVRASQKRKDSKEELALQFKEVRGILDEL